jgi:hypothetical protein
MSFPSYVPMSLILENIQRAKSPQLYGGTASELKMASRIPYISRSPGLAENLKMYSERIPQSSAAGRF